LIANGKKANVGTAPWNVGIYRLNKANSNYDLICGGSIISANLVVTGKKNFNIVYLQRNEYQLNIFFSSSLFLVQRDIV